MKSCFISVNAQEKIDDNRVSVLSFVKSSTQYVIHLKFKDTPDGVKEPSGKEKSWYAFGRLDLALSVKNFPFELVNVRTVGILLRKTFCGYG